MQPDSVRIADVRDWLRKARRDIEAGRHDLTADEPFLSDAAFHSQQAVEKSLKGFLAWHDEPFRKTHSLVELGGQCLRFDESLAELLRKAGPLSEYAWKFRYPGEPREPSLAEVQDALDIAEKLLAAILQRLPESVLPDRSG